MLQDINPFTVFPFLFFCSAYRELGLQIAETLPRRLLLSLYYQPLKTREFRSESLTRNILHHFRDVKPFKVFMKIKLLSLADTWEDRIAN